MPTLRTLTGDLDDMLGGETLPGVQVYIEHNLPPGEAVVDKTNNAVRLPKRQQVALDGSSSFTIAGLFDTDSTDLNVGAGTLQYQVVVDYPNGRGKKETWNSGWFFLTANTDLADLATTVTPVVADTAAGLIAEMEALRDQAAAPTAEQIAFVDADPASTFRTQQDARLSATYAPVAGTQRHPLTGRYHTSGYGAVGDWNGTTGTNNLPAFDAAVAALNADGGKGVIYIDEPGSYHMTGGWMITGDDVTVVCHPDAEILTTAATVGLGAAVTFMGGGGVQTPNNAVDTPQSTRAEWIGGRISASGSGTADNGLGFVRYKNVHVADVRLDADRKALTAQYNVDNIVWERFVVERGDVAAITVETNCQDVTIREFDVLGTLGYGIHIMSVDPAARRNARVRLRNGLIRSAGSWGVLAGATDVLDMHKVVVNSATTGKFNYTDCTNVTTDQPASAGATAKASGFGWENGESVALTFQNSWVSQGGVYPTPAAVRSPSGYVTLHGNIKSGTATAGTILCNLPVGYRPRAFWTGLVAADTGSAIATARITVATNGNVTLARGGSNFLLSLEQIAFYAALTS